MKGSFLLWAGLGLLVLLALAKTSEFFAGFETGALGGVAVVLLVLYPAILHGHEKRLGALERSQGERARASDS